MYVIYNHFYLITHHYVMPLRTLSCPVQFISYDSYKTLCLDLSESTINQASKLKIYPYVTNISDFISSIRKTHPITAFNS